MSIIEDITATIGDATGFKKMSKADILQLGFDVGYENITIKKKDGDSTLTLYKLKDEDKPKRNLDFCFLYSIKAKNGIVLPKPFDYYLRLVS